MCLTSATWLPPSEPSTTGEALSLVEEGASANQKSGLPGFTLSEEITVSHENEVPCSSGIGLLRQICKAETVLMYRISKLCFSHRPILPAQMGFGGILHDWEEPGGLDQCLVAASQHLGRLGWAHGEWEVETKQR